MPGCIAFQLGLFLWILARGPIEFVPNTAAADADAGAGGDARRPGVRQRYAGRAWRGLAFLTPAACVLPLAHLFAFVAARRLSGQATSLHAPWDLELFFAAPFAMFGALAWFMGLRPWSLRRPMLAAGVAFAVTGGFMVFGGLIDAAGPFLHYPGRDWSGSASWALLSPIGLLLCLRRVPAAAARATPAPSPPTLPSS